MTEENKRHFLLKYVRKHYLELIKEGSLQELVDDENFQLLLSFYKNVYAYYLEYAVHNTNEKNDF